MENLWSTIQWASFAYILISFYACEQLFHIDKNYYLKFVWSGESLSAEEPVANERSFSRMPPQVRSEVRRLSVNLVASGNVTNVLLFATATPITNYILIHI